MIAAFRSNLAQRVGTALVGLPALLAALFWAPLWVWIGVCVAVVLLGLHELHRLFATRGIDLMRLVAAGLALAFFIETAHPDLAVTLWPAGLVVLLVSVVARGGDFDKRVPSAAATLLAAAYMGGLGGTLAGLRAIDPSRDGAWRVVLLCAVVMTSDTCAYFVGRALGRHRLAPRISPGKTVEGGLGGLAGGMLGALVVWWLAPRMMPLGHALALGAVVAAAGVVGDLFESLLKRWAGIKDSGTLLPGHGGILDRVDGLLFGAPVLYYYFTWY